MDRLQRSPFHYQVLMDFMKFLRALGDLCGKILSVALNIGFTRLALLLGGRRVRVAQLRHPKLFRAIKELTNQT